MESKISKLTSSQYPEVVIPENNQNIYNYVKTLTNKKTLNKDSYPNKLDLNKSVFLFEFFIYELYLPKEILKTIRQPIIAIRFLDFPTQTLEGTISEDRECVIFNLGKSSFFSYEMDHLKDQIQKEPLYVMFIDMNNGNIKTIASSRVNISIFAFDYFMQTNSSTPPHPRRNILKLFNNECEKIAEFDLNLLIRREYFRYQSSNLNFIADHIREEGKKIIGKENTADIQTNSNLFTNLIEQNKNGPNELKIYKTQKLNLIEKKEAGINTFEKHYEDEENKIIDVNLKSNDSLRVKNTKEFFQDRDQNPPPLFFHNKRILNENTQIKIKSIKETAQFNDERKSININRKIKVEDFEDGNNRLFINEEIYDKIKPSVHYAEELLSKNHFASINEGIEGSYYKDSVKSNYDKNKFINNKIETIDVSSEFKKQMFTGKNSIISSDMSYNDINITKEIDRKKDLELQNYEKLCKLKLNQTESKNPLKKEVININQKNHEKNTIRIKTEFCSDLNKKQNHSNLLKSNENQKFLENDLNENIKNYVNTHEENEYFNLFNKIKTSERKENIEPEYNLLKSELDEKINKSKCSNNELINEIKNSNRKASSHLDHLKSNSINTRNCLNEENSKIFQSINTFELSLAADNFKNIVKTNTFQNKNYSKNSEISEDSQNAIKESINVCEMNSNPNESLKNYDSNSIEEEIHENY